MDRRRFMQTAVCFGATPSLSAMAFVREIACTDPEPNFPVPVLADTAGDVRIGVIAVGGAGGVIVTSLYGKLPYLSRSIAVDTHEQTLRWVSADQRILIKNGQVGPGCTRTARFLENDAKALIKKAAADLELAFIIVGMGETSGSEISLAVADVLKEQKITTIGVVINPLPFLDHEHHYLETAALGQLTRVIFRISSQFIPRSITQNIFNSPIFSQVTTAFEKIYRGIVLPISEFGLVNIDVADIQGIMTSEGNAAMGYGRAIGENAEKIAAQRAIAHPFLGEQRLRSASGILFSVEGPPADLAKLGSICRIMNTIRNAIGDVNHDQILFCGANRNEMLVDEFRVTILAGGVSVE